MPRQINVDISFCDYADLEENFHFPSNACIQLPMGAERFWSGHTEAMASEVATRTTKYVFFPNSCLQHGVLAVNLDNCLGYIGFASR